MAQLWQSGMRLTPARLNRPWQSYPVQWTATSNPSLGNGTLWGKWRYLDSDTVQIKILLVPGSTTTYGSGQYRFSLPVNADGTDVLMGASALFTGSLYPLAGWTNTSTPSSTLFMYRANPTANENLQTWSATSPITFASGHRVSVFGSYSIAS